MHDLYFVSIINFIRNDSFCLISVQTLDFLRFVCKTIFSPKRGDKLGYSGHRVICLVIMNQSCDSERLF